MKKITYTAMLSIAIAATSYGDIGISWSASGGFYFNGADANLDASYINGANSLYAGATAQLIWSVDNIADALDPFNVAGSYVSGDDILLRSFSVSNLYGDYGAGAPTIYSDVGYGVTLAGGYVYARIFDGSTPNVGEYYHASSPLLATAYNPGAPVLQTLDQNADPSFPAFGANELNTLIVPEPSVLAFLGLGGLALAARRRFVA